MTVKGFTKAQRTWILERDGFACQFATYDAVGGRWVLCRSKSELQVHHILPRGWVSQHLPYMIEDDSINGLLNGITLCASCHVGKNAPYNTIYAVHPDNEVARTRYQDGDKDAYNHMMAERKALNLAGIPYWNVRWDWMLSRRAVILTERFLKKQCRPYPKRRM